MDFDLCIARRHFLKQTAAGLSALAARSGACAQTRELQTSRIIPGKIPETVPGKLLMKWADEAMIRQAAELHPFDLQGRMNMAVNARTTCVDPNLGYIGYSEIHFETR